MRFSEYQATKMKNNNNESPQQGQQQQSQPGDNQESAAQLLQRYRKNVAKDRKADKYMNQKVDLAEAAWQTKPSMYYAQMDQLIAQAREDETKRQEEEKVVVEKGEQQQKTKHQQPTYHHHQHTVATTEYIDEKISYMETSMQEKLYQIEMTLDEKIAVALSHQQQETDPTIVLHHRQCTSSDCAMAGGGRVFAAHEYNILYILLGTLICLFGWWKSSQGVARKSLVNEESRCFSRNENKVNEDGWEDVVKSSSSSSSSSTDALKELAKKEGVHVEPHDDKLSKKNRA